MSYYIMKETIIHFISVNLWCVVISAIKQQAFVKHSEINVYINIETEIQALIMDY